MGVGGRYDERHPHLAEPVVRDPDDGHLTDLGVGQHQALHLGRVDVEPAVDEHVLHPVSDV